MLEVDSSKIIEVYSSSGQQLSVSGPRSTRFAYVDKAIPVPMPSIPYSLASKDLRESMPLSNSFSMINFFVKNPRKTAVHINGHFEVSILL